MTTTTHTVGEVLTERTAKEIKIPHEEVKDARLTSISLQSIIDTRVVRLLEESQRQTSNGHIGGFSKQQDNQRQKIKTRRAHEKYNAP